ncbi:hypothetical protein JQS43_10895 [Natronosporangium hydrolyticum]|uniref:Uncharacterized protein n=1 Tax=Natronosporangium hydrolyticum TaxID=2811111 RepID=A0A895YFU0_9ACTN|nr:hypothetical protein [Natronosporangium hydrolyticum]QSB16734.1 hypothetical protein JQS43_10895 [Natronosporangium hydrolyticum]
MINEHTADRAGVAEDVADDLEELEFSPLTPDEVAGLDDRIYLLGVHADRHRNIEHQLAHRADPPASAAGL